MAAVFVGVGVLLIILGLAPRSFLDVAMRPQVEERESVRERLLAELERLGLAVYRRIERVGYIRKMRDDIAQLLERMWHPAEKADAIVGFQWLAVAVLLTGGLLMQSALLLFLSLLAVPLVPMYLKSQWKKQQLEMSKDVLSLAELTAVGVSAGLPPLDALQVAVDGRNRPLFNEIQLAINRVRLGVPARDAFMTAAKRIDIQEFYAFMDQTVQAIETGAPGFSQTINDIVRHLREIRQARIEELVGKTEGKLLIPLVMFFGTIVVFLLGPLTYTFVNTF